MGFWCRKLARSIPDITLCNGYFRILEGTRTSIPHQRLYGPASMSLTMDESAISWLDGWGSGIIWVEPWDPISGCKTCRFISDKNDSRERDSTTAWRCKSFHSEQIWCKFYNYISTKFLPNKIVLLSRTISSW